MEKDIQAKSTKALMKKRVFNSSYTDKKVAIKVIDMEMLKSDLNQKLLNSEIEILKKLRNRNNILHLYDVIMTKNNTYLIS